MNDYDLFDKAFASVGLSNAFRFRDHFGAARTLFDTFSESFLSLASTFRSSYRPDREPPQILLGFPQDTQLNAAAFRHDNKYIIAINASTPVLLLKIFESFLADPRVLPEVGDSQKETHRQTMWAQDSNPFSMIKLTTKPSDPVRQSAAEQLTATVMSFILVHELHHVIAGHVDYARTAHLLPALRESGGHHPSATQCAILRGLEIDADAGATWSVTSSFQKLCTGRKHLPQLAGLADTPDRAARFVALAIHVFGEIFEAQQAYQDTWANWDHPPFVIRKNYMGGWASRMLLPEREVSEFWTKYNSTPESQIISYFFRPRDISLYGEDGKRLQKEIFDTSVAALDTCRTELAKHTFLSGGRTQGPLRVCSGP